MILDIRNAVLPVFHPPLRPASETQLLLRLNHYAQPGLYEDEFNGLMRRMVKCLCGMVMTERSFKHHRCQLCSTGNTESRPLKRRRVQEVIDLTREEVIDLTR